MPTPLFALALAAFAIGTSEFVIVGLLPDLAHDLHVTIPSAGLLVTGYALGVVVGAPILAITTARMPRKTALLALIGTYAAGNLLCAFAPNYALLMVARILTATCHGAFFGIGSIVAAELVPPARRGQAIAIMFSGLTLANVLGVPAGTALGQHAGWRAAFWCVVGIALAAAGALAWALPRLPKPQVDGLLTASHPRHVDERVAIGEPLQRIDLCDADAGRRHPPDAGHGHVAALAIRRGYHRRKSPGRALGRLAPDAEHRRRASRPNRDPRTLHVHATDGCAGGGHPPNLGRADVRERHPAADAGGRQRAGSAKSCGHLEPGCVQPGQRRRRLARERRIRRRPVVSSIAVARSRIELHGSGDDDPVDDAGPARRSGAGGPSLGTNNAPGRDRSA